MIGKLRFPLYAGFWSCLESGRLLHLQVMVRPFTLRDLPLVRRLSEYGIALHAESALADNLHPLRGALLSMVVGGDFPTFVWKADDRNMMGFVQLLLEEEGNHAHILYLSPAVGGSQTENSNNHDNRHDEAWLSLLDHAVFEAGQNGIHSLVAEVDELAPELPLLRRAGFAVYTRQDIWILDRVNLPTRPKTVKKLLPRQASDDWDIQLLYANMVPRLVQLVEPLPSLTAGEAWALRNDEDELDAFVHIHKGSVATWVRFFIHPNAETEADEIVTAVLQVNPPRPNHPIYCCVRRYEGWLPDALERNGFHLWGSQAVMVKHTVQHTKKPMPKINTVMEGQGVPVSSPYVQNFDKNEE